MGWPGGLLMAPTNERWDNFSTFLSDTGERPKVDIPFRDFPACVTEFRLGPMRCHN
jgi:hypothetical protein